MQKVNGLPSLINNYRERGKEIFEKFNAPVEDEMEYYGKVVKLLEKRLR